MKDVLNVRLGKFLNDRQVRIRWEDTWELLDLMDVERWMKVKRVIEGNPESIKVRWKDSWVSLESLGDGPLEDKARRLLEDRYSV
jgi:hypothetical protein